MRARRFGPYIHIIAACLAASCAEPEARESTRSDAERAFQERIELANSGRFLASRTIAPLALTPAEGQTLVDSLDIPAALNPTFVSGERPEPDAAVVRTSYGIIRPRNSQGTFLILSTGASGDEDTFAEPGTDFPPMGTDGDATTLQFQVTVPAGVNRMSFDYTFLSAESPDFINSVFNDTFRATVSDGFGANREVARASVNTAVFHPASATTVGPGPFQLYADDPSGVNTVFNEAGFAQVDAGTTEFQRVDVPVASGVVTIAFDIRDLGDGILDSAVIIDNMKFSAIEMVDPQHGLIDTFRGQVIRTTTTDPSDLARLATGGDPIHAVAADGITQVLLRSNVTGPGQAVFSVTSGTPSGATTEGSVSTDDGPPAWGSTATTNAILISGKWYAFALYRSPPDFNTGTNATDPSRVAGLAMRFTTSGNEVTDHDFSIEIVRPPVIVAPDIWSSCDSWRDLNGLMSAQPSDASLQQFEVTCADYQTTSSKSFTDEENRLVLDEAIRQALQRLRDAGVAATRADVVAHGMGGLLARRYMDEPSYLRFDNFNAGGINRLITMSTPHLGSRLADEMIRTRNAMKAADLANGTNNWQIARDTAASVGIHFDDADQDLALQEMGVNSPIVNQIGTTGRPGTVFHHAIIGTAGHALSRTQVFINNLSGVVAGGVKNYFIVMENNHPSVITPPLPPGIPNRQSLIFGFPDFRKSVVFCIVQDPIPEHNHHDLFVTTTEQRGGLDPAFTTSIPVSPTQSQTGHFNIQNNLGHTNQLIALLNAPVGGGQFATSMPSPGTQDRLNDCPILPPMPAVGPPPATAAHTLAQRTIGITSPAPGTIVAPGSTISVTVDIGEGEVPEAVLIMSAGSSELVEAAPFTATVQIPAESLGSTSLRAIAFYSGAGMAAAQPVALDVQTGATIASIAVINDDQVLRRPGRTRQLRVIATYTDGIRRDITQAAGTRYTISQLASIVQASSSGLITAVSPGEATVAITNGPAITSINVTVGPATCGDGVVDPDEECDDGNVSEGDGCSPTCQVENRAPVAVCTSPTRCNDPAVCAANITDLGASSFDPDGDTLAITQSPLGPYSVGTQPVAVTVSDGQLSAQCTSQVEVLDCEEPVLGCPADFSAECTGGGAATVTPPPADATDNCSVTIQSPATGQLPLGNNQLTYTARDPSSNVASCTTRVTVQDTIAPRITCPAPIVAECTDHSRAFVTPGQATSSDICTDVTVTGPDPGFFPLGTTAVNYSSSDMTGHQTSCSSTITVVDTQPPAVVAERRVTLWPPNHDYRTVTLDDCRIVVEDACRGQLPPDTYGAAITCVTSSEADDEPGDDDGCTRNDIIIVDERTVRLRAERDGESDGRVYKIQFEVRDQAGNTAPGVCKVVVPQDRRCARYGCDIDDDHVDHTVCR